MGYASIRKMLKGCADRAGIRKKFWPYLIRHSVLTSASKLLPYSLLCAVAGWKQGSKMPATYIKLSGEDIDQAHRMLNGIKDSPIQHHPSSSKECVRCKTMNSSDSKF